MCTMAINNQFNGIEITFESRPSVEIRDSLKALGFRWHGKKKLWYAKKSDERMALAAQLSGQKTPAEVTAPAPENSETVSRYGIKVGDILSGSWGYSMTIVDFYKVTKILSPCRVEIKEISRKRISADRGGGEYLMPDPDNEIGEAIKKTVMKDRYYTREERWYIKTEYCHLTPWGGEPEYQNTWD